MPFPKLRRNIITSLKDMFYLWRGLRRRRKLVEALNSLMLREQRKFERQKPASIYVRGTRKIDMETEMVIGRKPYVRKYKA